MPIRTFTLEQAARNFIAAYKQHLQGGSSVVGMFDPRQCDQCRRAFDDLVFALDGQAPKLEAISGSLDRGLESRIIDLFGKNK
jgi:hypothetical protein